MDNLQSDLNDDISEDEESQTTMKQASLLHVYTTKGHYQESGFHKTARLCLHAMRDAMLHHRWQEAAQYLQGYTQTLEDTTTYKQIVACEVIWRLATEVLRHHPNKDLEHFNVLYKRMKNNGVKNYTKISLEHAFHLLLNGQMENARQELSVAMSWRYGKQSENQSLDLKLINAYCGFLDYLVWSTKRSSMSDGDDCENNHEMHSNFRKACMTLQEIIKHPGVWDPFICGCIDMLEFYSDEEQALQLLKTYAYNKDYPANPNAHVYLYMHQKRHKASPAKLMDTLKALHSLVPSHELMLEYCSLLIKSGVQKHLQLALRVAMDLLEYSSWKADVNAWTCLLEILKCLRKKDVKNLIKEEWEGRKDLWLKMHYKTFHSKKESEESSELTHVKIKVMKLFDRCVVNNQEEKKKWRKEELKQTT